MVSVLQVVISVIAVAVVVAIATGAIYYWVIKPTSSSTPPRPPVPPTPGQETFNVEFYNGLTQPVIVIRVNGSATDNNDWTSWPEVPGQSNPAVKVTPHASGADYKTLQPGETGTFAVLTAGVASSGYIVRVNCDPTTQICEIGDSKLIVPLDGPTYGDWYRDKTSAGIVPPKPAIDTRVEFTWGCAYEDRNLCGINPSCITNPANPGCVGLPQLMAANPTAKFSTNGLLYKPDGAGGYTNIPLTNTTASLAPDTFFDISCVDGFTVPMVLQVRRPSTGITSGSLCHLHNGFPLDGPTGAWQTLANTAHLADLTGQCPTTEILWPAANRVVDSTVAPPGDGYNVHGGTTQFPMPWVTQGTPGAPAGTKLLAAFGTGTASATDLHVFRNPAEVVAVENMGWTVNNVIGCASPCSILTKDSATTVMYPKPASGNIPAGHFTTATFLPVGTSPLLTTDRGVSEVCCQPAPGSDPVGDSNLQCNTSTWWTDPPGIGPASVTAAVVQYNYGFYVNVFAPSPGPNQPWWSDTITGSINPYSAYPPNVSFPVDKYVDKIRNGLSGQAQTTRAYSYAHDDAWSTLVCGTISPNNLLPSDGRGPYYNRYDIRVTIGTTPPP